MSLNTPRPDLRCASRLILTAILPIARLAIALFLYIKLLNLFTLLARHTLPWADTAPISQLAQCLAALGDLAVIVILTERRPIREVGFRCESAVRNFGLGVTGGSALMIGVITVMFLAGWYRITGSGSGGWGNHARLWSALIFAAAAEEIMYRALTFRLLEECLGSWLALLGSSVYFGWVHAQNPASSWASAVGISLAGAFLGSVYMVSRDLWFVIGAHWAWNMFQGPVFGAPISGHRLRSLVQATIEGPERWTGGAFGPEAGVPVMVILALATLATLAVATRTGGIRSPGWFTQWKEGRSFGAPPGAGLGGVPDGEATSATLNVGASPTGSTFPGDDDNADIDPLPDSLRRP